MSYSLNARFQPAHLRVGTLVSAIGARNLLRSPIIDLSEYIESDQNMPPMNITAGAYLLSPLEYGRWSVTLGRDFSNPFELAGDNQAATFCIAVAASLGAYGDGYKRHAGLLVRMLKENPAPSWVYYEPGTASLDWYTPMQELGLMRYEGNITGTPARVFSIVGWPRPSQVAKEFYNK